MTDAEMLVKVKDGMPVAGPFNDTQLQIKSLSAVKIYMLNAGVTQENIENDLGYCHTNCGSIGLVEPEPRRSKISRRPSAYFLLPQLMAVSLDV